MNTSEQTSFEQANQKVHPVEKQWHFPILTKFGYTPITPQQTGFVRTYVYEKDGHQITCTTGSHADYWRDEANAAGGYWVALEPHLRKLAGTV